jgi:hypothetical protein
VWVVARSRRGVSQLSGSSGKVDRVDQFVCAREFLEREIAMYRVEEIVETIMMSVLHDWELDRAMKAIR